MEQKTIIVEDAEEITEFEPVEANETCNRSPIADPEAPIPMPNGEYSRELTPEEIEYYRKNSFTVGGNQPMRQLSAGKFEALMNSMVSKAKKKAKNRAKNKVARAQRNLNRRNNTGNH